MYHSNKQINFFKISFFTTKKGFPKFNLDMNISLIKVLEHGEFYMIHEDIKTQIASLKADSTSGAKEFIDKAINVIKNQISLIKNSEGDIKSQLLALSKELINARPSMAPLINTVGFLLHNLSEFNKVELEKQIFALYIERLKINKEISVHFQNFMDSMQKSNPRIMLLSYSSTIIELIQNLHDIKPIFYILEARPLLEGHKAAEILSIKFDTTLIVDAAMGRYINDIDFVLIGIDSILRDGSIINKIGTSPLAYVAKEYNKKIYAVGDRFKYNLRSHFQHEVLIEKKPIDEIYQKSIKNILFKVENYYFDVTPPNYIDAIISDLGVLPVEQFLIRIKDYLPIIWFKQFL